MGAETVPSRISWFVAGSAMMLLVVGARGDNCAPLEPGLGVTTASKIRLIGDTSGVVVAGADMWDVCGSSIPEFVHSGQGDIEIQVVLSSGQNPGSPGCNGCSCAGAERTTTPNGSALAGGTVWVYGQDASGGTCHNPIQDVAHELGHILGLDDGTCSQRIMYEFPQASSVEVTQDDCNAIKAKWEVPTAGGGGGGNTVPCLQDL